MYIKIAQTNEYPTSATSSARNAQLYRSAVNVTLPCLRISPDALCYSLLAEAYTGLGIADTAFRYCFRTLDIDNTSESARCSLLRLYALKGMSNEFFRSLTSWATLLPKDFIEQELRSNPRFAQMRKDSRFNQVSKARN